MKGAVRGRLESYPHEREEQPRRELHEIVVTGPRAQDVVVARKHVCQVRLQRHIEVRALAEGYLEEILGRRARR